MEWKGESCIAGSSKGGHRPSSIPMDCGIRNHQGVKFFKAIADLVRLDPGKKHPDLWNVGREVQVPYAQYGQIAEAIAHVFVRPPLCRRSAIVAADELQKAQFEMYRMEASSHPLDIRVFRSRNEAITWIKSPETSAAGN